MVEERERKHAAKTVGLRTAYHLQFITTPTSDTPGTTLLLHFDNKRYLFGEITEGTQRACIQRGIALRKVRGLFLAGKTAWNNGGLIGMVLSLADVQSAEVDPHNPTRRPRLHIYAGPKQLHSLACARRFIFRTGMPLSVHEFDMDNQMSNQRPLLEDENIQVWGIAAQHKSATHSIPAVDGLSDSSDAEAEPFNTNADDRSQVKLEQDIRSEIVKNMFDSGWHRDRLSEQKVKDIKLPAVVWVRDPETKELNHHTLFDMTKISPLSPESDVLVRDPWPASTVEQLPESSNLPNRTAMSYIIKGHPQRGSFDPKRAKALGVKPGPIYSKLVAGMSVTLDDGTVVTSDMVMSASRPGKGFAIFDVPSTGYLPDLQKQLAEQKALLEGVELVVWLTRDDLPFSDQFQNLLQGMKDVKHVISHPDICKDYVAHESSARSSLNLSKISPEFFFVPRCNHSAGYRPSSGGTAENIARLLDVSHSGIEIAPARPGLKVHIEPSYRINDAEVPLHLDYAQAERDLNPEIKSLIPFESSPEASIPKMAAQSALIEPEIITLGTGSAAPSKYRNVSSVLLRMPNGLGNYLFDCGEGTLGQLKRLFDADQLEDILYNLKAVWISHLHADHHLGTISVLQAAYQVRRKLAARGMPSPSPPLLMSEVNMMDYIEEYRSVLSIPANAICIPIACHWMDGLLLHGQPFEFESTDIPIQVVKTVRVSHCHGAQAISVTFANGFKFSYSGDCRPSQAFCEIGADSDVLVHEATFDDGMDGDARAKKHSTTGEAVGVALQMRAKNLILTHFSQRYQKIPILSNIKLPEQLAEEDIDDVDDPEVDSEFNQAETEPSNASSQNDARAWTEPSLTQELPIAIAFDLMRVRVSQIRSMKLLFPAISKMFELDEARSEQERQERVSKQREREAAIAAEKLMAQGKNLAGKVESNKAKQILANGQGKKSARGSRKREIQAEDGERSGTVDSPSTNAKMSQISNDHHAPKSEDVENPERNQAMEIPQLLASQHLSGSGSNAHGSHKRRKTDESPSQPLVESTPTID